MTYEAQPGRLCRSRSGRDAGRYFLITDAIDDKYVHIADGMMRKISAPKKKKLKHLELKPEVLEGIAGKLAEGIKVFDAELASAIRASRYYDKN